MVWRGESINFQTLWDALTSALVNAYASLENSQELIGPIFFLFQKVDRRVS